ncbi:FG-GAP-like repeat-containing protein [Aestuariimicrobium kwangyangense]|uniref:FG-GAP-like repeat-containing protein n=1 Tax=Aestuariimicrobium kwangyangense TaxID=396389 RepID=UPI0003B6D807|nr:FG-GAP-like repeat-containing protein [Aestuariimicrobium kwangyangense]
MRPLAGLLTSALLSLALLAQPLPAAATTVSVPDIELRTCVNDTLGQAANAPITDAQMRTLTTLDCFGAFSSITGLQYATNLVTLDLALGDLSGSLTVPKQWTKLKSLRMWGNRLTQVTIPGTLTSLREIDLSSNDLTSFTLPNTLVQVQQIDVSGNHIGSLHQLSWLPRETQVWAFGQVVELPAWTTGTAYPLVSRRRDGSTTSLSLPAGVTRTPSGLVYAKAGSYSISFNGDDETHWTTSFDGRFVQRVTTTSTTAPSGAKGDHTGDRIADVYAVDSSGALQFYRGSTSSGLTLVGSRGSGWSGMSYLTQVGDVSGDGWSDLIARRRSDNSLWLYKAGAGGHISGAVQIGRNWGGIDQIVPVANLAGTATQYVVGRQASTGALYRYTLTPTGLTGITQIGRNWNGMRQIIGLGDFTGDGRADVLAIRTDGTLWAYQGTTQATIGAGKQVGRGWTGFRQAFSAGDISGDGRPDLFGQRDDGTVYVYNNLVGTWSYPRVVMSGTQGFRLLA